MFETQAILLASEALYLDHVGLGSHGESAHSWHDLCQS